MMNAKWQRFVVHISGRNANLPEITPEQLETVLRRWAEQLPGEPGKQEQITVTVAPAEILPQIPKEEVGGENLYY